MKRFVLAAVLGGIICAVPSMAGATAPQSIDLPAKAKYKGTVIPTRTAVRLGLHCSITTRGLACFDTRRAARTDAGKATRGFTTAASCAPYMVLYGGSSFTGSSLSIALQSTWINLGNFGWSNVVSSWSTGCAGGKLADGTNGAGARIGLAAFSQQASLGSFNNVASSALRCPC